MFFQKEWMGMTRIGVICEYNPFHNGHARHLRMIREAYGEDCVIVCLMSGNFVQRGDVAIFAKHDRAEAAVRCGADLVLELPISCALSSAEGFAAGGVELLERLGCDVLSFGSECGREAPLMHAAKLQLDPSFDRGIVEKLREGVSYPAARAAVLQSLGAENVLADPNDILGVEYCKAMLRKDSRMKLLVVRRNGDYHSPCLDAAAPSASALRACMAQPEQWQNAVPDCLHRLYRTAERYSLAAGERAMLSRLRTLPDSSFASLPFGSEGLWSKLMKNCRSAASVEEIITGTKSKRYARTRIQRMLFCAFLGLDEELMHSPPPYVRVLAFNVPGRAQLRPMRERFALLDSGECPQESAYAALERCSADLFSLFSEGPVVSGGAEARLRNRYVPSAERMP